MTDIERTSSADDLAREPPAWLLRLNPPRRVWDAAGRVLFVVACGWTIIGLAVMVLGFLAAISVALGVVWWRLPVIILVASALLWAVYRIADIGIELYRRAER